MAGKKSLAGEQAQDYCTRFPNTSTRAIGRKLFQDFPSLYTDAESARVFVQRCRGEGLKSQRQYAVVNRSIFKAGSTIPEGIRQLGDWKPFDLGNSFTALVFGDVHLPFHDKQALETAIAHGKKRGVDIVICNGDTHDFFAISRWEKDPRLRNFPKELELGRDFYAYIKAQFPKARIVTKQGNHEERLIAYMRLKAPELLGIEALEFEELLGLSARGIEYVQDKRPILLGDLTLLHGHEYRFAIANPVNPARGLFLRTKAYAMCNHFHQSSYHSENTVRGRRLAAWSIGCLCDLNPEYLPLNNWSHGFAVVEAYKDGKFNVDHKVISNGRIL